MTVYDFFHIGLMSIVAYVPEANVTVWSLLTYELFLSHLRSDNSQYLQQQRRL